jgi:hypothetical protein
MQSWVTCRGGLAFRRCAAANRDQARSHERERCQQMLHACPFCAEHGNHLKSLAFLQTLRSSHNRYWTTCARVVVVGTELCG